MNANEISKARKRVGINQSSYIPWRGYFDFINSCDLFLIFDDVQYTNRDWRNRNRIKTPNGSQWLTVPVAHSRTDGTLVMNANIVYNTDWIADHEKWITISLGKTLHFDEFFPEFRNILRQNFETISQLNVALIEWVCRTLEIRTPLQQSHLYAAEGKRGGRILDLLIKTEATEYLSGPSARAYLEPEQFRKLGIDLYFKSYDYLEYPQTHLPYDPAVTILDLLCTVGQKAARPLILSETPDEPAVQGAGIL